MTIFDKLMQLPEFTVIRHADTSVAVTWLHDNVRIEARAATFEAAVLAAWDREYAGGPVTVWPPPPPPSTGVPIGPRKA